MIVKRAAFLRLTGLGAATLALGRPRGFAAEPTTAPADLGTELQPLLSKHNIPALAAVALRGDQIIGEAFTGVRRRGHNAKITRADRFHLGSDTKAMTATLAALRVEEGKLAWTTTLAAIFGDAAIRHAAWKQVTLQQLLTHRAGLPRNVRFRPDKALPLAEQRARFVTAVLAEPPEHAPDTQHLYSNAGYIMAGAMLERICGCAWEDLMRDRLFKPLGITAGGFGAPQGDNPWGHTERGNPVDAATPAADNPPFLGPAGTAHMTMADWSRFVALHLRGSRANPRHVSRLLKPESFAHLHRPPAGQNYASGWGTGTRPWARGEATLASGQILTHAGSNTMWFCVAWLAPEIDFAALIASNQAGPAATKACDEAVGILIRRFARPRG